LTVGQLRVQGAASCWQRLGCIRSCLS
jgi:hypothetical protein